MLLPGCATLDSCELIEKEKDILRIKLHLTDVIVR